MSITIITASYNSASTIQACIDSVFYQSYCYKEHIILDGKSSDNTLDIIRLNQNKINTFVSEKDVGIYDALNKGIKKANGEIIGFLHSDDLYANNNVLSKVAEVFKKTGVDCVYGDLVYFNQHNCSKTTRYWRAGAFNKKLIIKGWMPPHPTLFIKKSIYNEFGLFDLRYKIAADYDLILRFFYKYGITSYYIPEILVKMSSGGMSNKNLRNILFKSKEDYLTLASNNISYPLIVLLRKNLSKLHQFYEREMVL